jgi:hypothetical protein
VPVQRRRITPEEYHQLATIGVLGEGGVELRDGWIVYGKFPFAFTDEAAAAARDAGIVLDHPEEPPLPPAPSGSLKPDADLTRTLTARRVWAQLEPIMRILVEQGRVHIATAMSWLAGPDEALDGHSPASWLAAGRDPETVALIAGRDAERLAQ